MLFLEILFVFLTAAVIGAIFYYMLKYTGPWGSFWSFFLILILAGIAAAAWIEPTGPVIWDIAWFPVLFVILLFALLLAAATPSDTRSRSRRQTTTTDETAGGIAFVSLSAFFWIFLLFLLIAAVVGLFR